MSWICWTGWTVSSKKQESLIQFLIKKSLRTLIWILNISTRKNTIFSRFTVKTTVQAFDWSYNHPYRTLADRFLLALFRFIQGYKKWLRLCRSKSIQTHSREATSVFSQGLEKNWDVFAVILIHIYGAKLKFHQIVFALCNKNFPYTYYLRILKKSPAIHLLFRSCRTEHPP